MIHGYTYDTGVLPRSPVSDQDLNQLLGSILWSDEDSAAMRQAASILSPQTEDILDLWYGFVGSTPHLVSSFAGSDGTPDGEYLTKVRGRFGQWIVDLCSRDFDDDWLAYQEEIGRRHHPVGKNQTDGVDSTSHVEMRHLIGLIVPITVTIRSFLANSDATPEQIEAMYQAWFKAVVLSVALWARPYAPDLW